MLEDLPSSRLAVYIFLEMIALGFALEAVSAFMHGEVWWKWSGALAMGVVFMVLGVKSERIRKKFSLYLNSRLVWTATFWVVFTCSLYFVQRWAPDSAMNLHQRLQGTVGFVIVALVGAILSCGCWWFTGRVLRIAPTTNTGPFILAPQQRAELERLRGDIYRAKAALLEQPEFYKAKVARNDYRKLLEETETKHGCLIDVVKLECLPKPPTVITRTELEISISAIAIADEISKSRFWVVRKQQFARFRVPIAMLASLTNHQQNSVKIDLLYLEAKSPMGEWADVRMADSLMPPVETTTMDSKPLVMELENGYGQMKGEYLLPSLYNRLIPPGTTTEGWIIAEYPKGIAYDDLIGDLRISVQDANKHWISSKVFAGHPAIYPKENKGEIINGNVVMPLDLYIDED